MSEVLSCPPECRRADKERWSESEPMPWICHSDYLSLSLGNDDAAKITDQLTAIETHDPLGIGDLIRHFKCVCQLLEYLSSDSGTGVSLADLVDRPIN